MLVGEKVDTSLPKETLKEIYIKLLSDSVENRKSFDFMVNERLKKAISFLEESDFFEAPASASYHGAEIGGLLRHSLDVYNCMLGLKNTDKFKGVNIYSATLVCLVHDWCKIGLYECYMKNVKNEYTGKWEKKPGYRYKNVEDPFGHGAGSMYMALKYFDLTREEALAIRWHMGRWNVVQTEFNELKQSNENYPIVLLLQFSDQLSIVSY